MMEALFDDTAFQRVFGTGASLLVPTSNGLTVATSDSSRALRHRDDLLALSAELGMPLNASLRVESREMPLARLLEHAIEQFALSQELEFTAVALAKYLPPQSTWENGFGDSFSFDDLSKELMQRQGGACFNAHVPYALSLLLEIQHQQAILSPPMVAEIHSHLTRLSTRIEEGQAEDGAWIPELPRLPQGLAPTEADRLRFIGHSLEWIAQVDTTLAPSKASVAKAVKWASEYLHAQPASVLSLVDDYPARSHATRGLLWLHGVTAAEIYASAD